MEVGDRTKNSPYSRVTHLAVAQGELVPSVKACVPRPPSRAQSSAAAQESLASLGARAASPAVWAWLRSAWGTRDVVSALRDP